MCGNFCSNKCSNLSGKFHCVVIYVDTCTDIFTDILIRFRAQAREAEARLEEAARTSQDSESRARALEVQVRA